MNDVLITAETLDDALRQASERFAAPLEALEYEKVEIDEDELLTHTDEELAVSIRVWIKSDYLSERSCQLLTTLLEHMQHSVQVNCGAIGSLIRLQIVSDANSRLIGRNGETLEAIEYVLNRMLTRGGVVAPPVIVDVENYRQRRVTYLERLAKRMAAKAVKTKEEVALHPLKASERKIIHAILSPLCGVNTVSRGIDDERQVVIVPDGNKPDPELLGLPREKRRRGKPPTGDARGNC
jgi:spoIIIJ-associated protein